VKIIGYTNKCSKCSANTSDFLPCTNQRVSRIWEDAAPVCVRLGYGAERACRRPDRCPYYEVREVKNADE